MWVLRHLATAPAELDLPVLQLAALYHDAIYDPRAVSPANEVASADLAAIVATDLGWDVDRVALVRRLVLSTAHLEPTAHADPHEQTLIAADLAILGADPADYAAYVAGVRAEYAHVSDPDWRVGRSAVLQHLLTFDTLSSRAQANLTAELAQYSQ
jgi:predicted metal-dependent HD superfamily phosphohydrolase